MPVATNPMIKANFAVETTDQLLSIWTANDQNAYSPAAFAAIHELLTERGIAPPQQLLPPKPPGSARGGGMISLGVALVFLAILCSAARVSYMGVSHSTSIDALLDLVCGGTLVTGLVVTLIGIIKRVRTRSGT